MNPFCRLYSSIYCVESVISTVGLFTTHTIVWQSQLIYFPPIKITIVIVIRHSSTSRKNSFLSPCISPPRVDITRTKRREDKEDCVFLCVCGCWNTEVSPYFVAVYKRWVTQGDLLQPETVLRWGELIVHWEIIAICRKLRSSGYELISSQFSFQFYPRRLVVVGCDHITLPVMQTNRSIMGQS